MHCLLTECPRKSEPPPDGITPPSPTRAQRAFSSLGCWTLSRAKRDSAAYFLLWAWRNIGRWTLIAALLLTFSPAFGRRPRPRLIAVRPAPPDLSPKQHRPPPASRHAKLPTGADRDFTRKVTYAAAPEGSSPSIARRHLTHRRRGRDHYRNVRGARHPNPVKSEGVKTNARSIRQSNRPHLPKLAAQGGCQGKSGAKRFRFSCSGSPGKKKNNPKRTRGARFPPPEKPVPEK